MTQWTISRKPKNYKNKTKQNKTKFRIKKILNTKKEFFHNVITEADLTYIIKGFTISEINSANINELILSIIECFNG